MILADIPTDSLEWVYKGLVEGSCIIGVAILFGVVVYSCFKD